LKYSNYIFNISRSDDNTKKVRTDNNNSKKNRSSTGSRHALEDETEKQLEMQLLDSPPGTPKIRQPSKEVIMT
jgi:hypothetical protein